MAVLYLLGALRGVDARGQRLAPPRSARRRVGAQRRLRLAPGRYRYRYGYRCRYRYRCIEPREANQSLAGWPAHAYTRTQYTPARVLSAGGAAAGARW
eukprot:scaffold63005_cov65-Phaeocystis_antarctica.AAC.4